jgi:hypothetical protein
VSAVDSTAAPAEHPPQHSAAEKAEREAAEKVAAKRDAAARTRGSIWALILMRIGAMQRTGRSLAPALGALVILSVLYGGGQARPAEAYGVSAVLLFPVFAWQTKILLDVEPDIQRRLVLVALRSRKVEVAAGLIGAALAALPLILAALALPWLFGAVTLHAGGPGLAASWLLGLWVHAVVVPPAVALGAWCSRVVLGNAGRAITALAAGVTAVMLLGLKSSPLPWLAPPLLSAARTLTAEHVNYPMLLPLTAWALAWAGVLLGGYAWLRRRRA